MGSNPAMTGKRERRVSMLKRAGMTQISNFVQHSVSFNTELASGRLGRTALGEKMALRCPTVFVARTKARHSGMAAAQRSIYFPVVSRPRHGV
jgi:hypothetical protein